MALLFADVEGSTRLLNLLGERFGTDLLVLTTPFPIYGIFRYLYLVHRQGMGDPSEALLADRPLLACVASWAVVVALIIYRPFGS